MELNYRTIKTEEDHDVILSFFIDATLINEGTLDGFDETEYLSRINNRVSIYPKGYVLVEMDSRAIGQLELQIKTYQNQRVGYISLIYLISEFRGKGIGKDLIQYAESFFKEQLVREYHLRVLPHNEQAFRFYIRQGLNILREETSYLNQPVLRLYKKLSS